MLDSDRTTFFHWFWLVFWTEFLGTTKDNGESYFISFKLFTDEVALDLQNALDLFENQQLKV